MKNKENESKKGEALQEDRGECETRLVNTQS